MRKRTYRAVAVKQVERLVDGVSERLILGCDAAKELWYALPAKIVETLHPREFSVEGGEVSGS